jgi:Colicin V production protein
MIAVATTQITRSMSLDHLPFGWFDVALVAILAFGLYRGRRNGMTKEVLPMFQWAATFFACGLSYEIVGQLIINLSGWGKLPCYLLGYFIVMFAVYLIFQFLKKLFTERLTGSNFFGSGEYYLGTISGMIRYACMLLVALALLNAPYYSAADVIRAKAYNARWYGGGQQGYTGDFFPTVQSVQEEVFKTSFLGPFIKNYLGVFFINTVSDGGDNQKPMQQKQPMIHIGN